MNSDKFVYYDADFLAKFKKLAEVMEEKDKAVLHRYLIDNFSHIFKVFQYYAREDGNGEFISVEDLHNRSKVSNSVIQTLVYMGVTGSIPESNQISLF